MKAGTFKAGRGPAGVGPVPPGQTPLTPRVDYGAPAYDLATRQILQNPDGTFQTIHPVDAKVRLALGILLGSIPSVPTVGCAVSATRQTAKAPQELSNDMTFALESLVSAGDIDVIAITVDQSVPGRTIRSCQYVNLRLPNSKPQTVGV